jgi:hypothetical protein
MFNLIELTQTEVALQDMSFTLKEIAEKFGIRHDNAMRDFRKDFDKLSTNHREVLTPQIEELKFSLKNNQSYATLKISLPLMLWFSAKYSPELRMNIVNYALTKLDDERKELVLTIQKNEEETKKLQKKIHQISVNKFNKHQDFNTASRLVHELNLNMTASDLLDELTERGVIETTTVTRQVRKPLDDDLTMTGPKGELLISQKFVKKILEL